MSRELKDEIRIGLLSALCGYPLDLIRKSWRVESVWMHLETQALLEAKTPVIFALWHGRMYSLLRGVDPNQVSILVSPSNDGEFIVRTVRLLGFRHMIRGSHKRGGRSAILGMHRSLKEEGRSVVFTVDGPRGPRYKVKPGVIKLAQQTGAPIIPLASATRWLLKKFDRSWDHYHAPAPFTGMHLRYGEPLRVPPAPMEDEALEPYRAELEARLMALNLESDAIYGLDHSRL